MVKKEKLRRVLKIIKEANITAYEIASNTSLSEVGVNKILNGTSTNPHQTTVDSLVDFLTNNKGFNPTWFDAGEGTKLAMNLPGKEELDNLLDEEREEIIKKISSFIAYNEKMFLQDQVFYNLVERKAYELMIKMMQDNPPT